MNTINVTHDKRFTAACERADAILKDRPGYRGVKPTRRQYRKWQRKEGTAYQFGRDEVSQ